MDVQFVVFRLPIVHTELQWWMLRRYQVNSLVAMCKEFQRKQFTIDTNNCCTILEQTYQFLEAPIGLQIMCQDIILQNMIELQQDNSLAEKFVKLSFSIVKEIAKASLPRMFLLDPFPANYITMSAALLEWLDHDESTREEKAVELLTFLEFESLGLEGIARIMDRPHPKKNWVRSYPALEQKLLNAISLAGRKPIKHIQSKALNCDQGRWTFVCRGGCNKKHKGATVVTTFELKQPVSLYIYVSTHGHTGCAVYATCNKNTKHLLVAAGGGGNEDAKFYGVQQDSGMDEKPGRPNTSRPSSARWKCCSLWLGNERKLDVSTCHGTVHSAGASYIHPIGEEIIQTWSAGPQSSVTIYSRTTSSQSLTVENTECSTV